VYADAEWAALGFTILDPTLQDRAGRAASKLKLKKHPAISELVTFLKRSPPGDEATARQWFEILSGRLSGRISNLYPFESFLNLSLPCRSRSNWRTGTPKDTLRTRKVHRRRGYYRESSTKSVLPRGSKLRALFQAICFRGFWRTCQCFSGSLWC
jgi:hypothetical protein